MKKITVLILLFSTSISFAQYTAIPDQNFEQALIDLGLDDVIDGQVLTATISSVVELSIDERGIQDLTGIEGFVSLEYLGAYDNDITYLDLSQNTQLVEIDLDYNPLETLIISNNPNLAYLFAEGTELVSLDTSNCPQLINLVLFDSKINSLDLSQNPLLEELDVDNNFLIELDLSQNPNLEQLYIGYNPFLNFLDIKNGNTSNITDLEIFQIAQNHCVQVDDAAAATAGTTFPYNIWQFEDQAIVFSENCELSTVTHTPLQIVSYPNPVTDKLYINSNETLTYSVYNQQGQLVLGNKLLENNRINMSHFTTGVYFVHLKSESKEPQTIKVIKK